jgi:hypothetical protein
MDVEGEEKKDLREWGVMARKMILLSPEGNAGLSFNALKELAHFVS